MREWIMTDETISRGDTVELLHDIFPWRAGSWLVVATVNQTKDGCSLYLMPERNLS